MPGASRPDGTPRRFTWDAENRLVRVEPADGYSPVSGDVKVEFRYDYMGRRVEKKVSTHNGSSWAVTDTRRFIWYNWLMLLELNGSNELLKKYTWGLDLAGLSGQVNSLESAGGIGGLLACYDTAGTSGTGDDKSYAYMFDGNGNVGQLIDVADGSIDAHYEYDAYGNADVAIGSYATGNTVRFSTKYWDDATGLGNWGLRNRDPERWINRDPLGENGGVLLYQYADSAPTYRLDPLGLQDCDVCCCAKEITVENLEAIGKQGAQVSQWGHSFDLVATIEFIAKPKDRGVSACKFEWFEYYTNLQGNYKPEIPVDPNMWNDMVIAAERHKKAPEFVDKVGKFLEPPKECTGVKKLRHTDTPSMKWGKDEPTFTAHRVLWIIVRLTPAPGCPCKNKLPLEVALYQELSVENSIGGIRRLSRFGANWIPKGTPGGDPWVRPPNYP